MITRKDEHKIDNANSVLGGSGNVQFFRLIEKPEELYNKGRVFSITATASFTTCSPALPNTATTAKQLPSAQVTPPSAPTAKATR